MTQMTFFQVAGRGEDQHIELASWCLYDHSTAVFFPLFFCQISYDCFERLLTSSINVTTSWAWLHNF